MRDTVVMVKETEGGIKRVEIASNKKDTFGGNKQGKANWMVFPTSGKCCKVSTLSEVYKQLKADGFKVVGIC